MRPDNPAVQSKINEILAKASETWTNSAIFIRALDDIAKVVFGEGIVRDLKTNKDLTGDLYTCPDCGGQFLNSSKAKSGDKWRCEYCYFGNIKRKQEKLIDDLLGKFE